MKLKTILLAAAASLVIAPAANAGGGVYGAIGAGLSYMKDDVDLSNDESGGSGAFIFDSDADYDRGYGGYFALGKHLGDGFRGELELSYRENDVRHITSSGVAFSGFPETTLSGDTKVFAFLVNLIYDFDFADGPFTPYLGAGVGAASVDHDIIGSNPLGAPVAPLTIGYGDSAVGLAYQGIAGVGIDLAEGLILDISYRYFGVLDQHYDATLSGADADIQAEYVSHTVFAGLRFDFGGAAAPVQYKDCWDGRTVPITAECPPMPQEDLSANLDDLGFTVYFDLDKSNLSQAASETIATAAAQALQGDIDAVIVSGNTDTSGSASHNQGLSDRRAKVVRDALIARGVSAGMIRTEAFGENNLKEATADGVREPLNRRTDVVISFE